jgi:hypothetical protein
MSYDKIPEDQYQQLKLRLYAGLLILCGGFAFGYILQSIARLIESLGNL